MAKIAILGDLHLGAKQDDEWVQKNQREFFQMFFEYCGNNDIDTVFQLGDWFDVRRGISQETMKFQREFVNPLMNDYTVYALVGNHDMLLREHITPNSIREVLGKLDNVVVIEEPTTITIDNIDFDFIPWMCKENSDQVAEFVSNSSSEYCLGHFELNGFWFARGQKSSGIDGGFLSRYSSVWSGHFHTISESGNIRYMGTPYTMTLADADDKRGFHVFDTETHELEFVENPDCWHTKLYFNADTFDTKTIEWYTDKTVKIIVEKRSTDSRDINFDVIEDRIAQVAHKLDTLDEIELVGVVSDDIKSIKDVDEYVKEYVQTIDESTEIRDRIQLLFSALHLEAKEMR